MPKLLIKILILVAGCLVLLVTVNYRIDKYCILQGDFYDREIVEMLQSGQNIYGYHETQLDERNIMRQYILTTKPLDYAVLGSSRGLQITKDYVPADSRFFNFGVSGSDVRDLFSFYYLMEKNDVLPHTLICALDPWLLYDSPDSLSPRSKEPIYNEFLTQVLDIPKEYEKPDYAEIQEALLSPSIFQENIAFHLRDTSHEKHPMPATGDLFQAEETIRMADGSQLYDIGYRNRSTDEVELEAWALVTNGFFRVEGFQQISPMLQKQFEGFVNRAQSKGVELIFVLSPYHPTSYQLALDGYERFPAFFDMELYFRQLAKEKGILVYGSFDPAVSGCISTDFYDGLHIKREAMPLVFPGIEGSLIYANQKQVQAELKEKTKKMETLMAQDIHEPWMEELLAYLNRPMTARLPQPPV